MPETSTPTLTPDGTTKIPAFQNNNPGNVEVDALKAYILSQAGLANGLATLDENGKLDSSQIPVNLDDVLVYPSYASLPATGETGKLYITSDVNGTYYWNGTSYQILNQSFVRYRGSLSSLPSDPQPGDWFIAASSFSSYTSGHIYLYNGSSWDDVTAVFGQFVLKTDIAQNLGQQTDKVPSNKAVDDAINAINTRVTNIEETLMGENEITVSYPNDGNYSSLMPNKVPSRALKFAEVPRFRGKTRAWNQLVENGNFVDISGWTGVQGTIAVNNNKCVFTAGSTLNRNARLQRSLSVPSGHALLVGAYVKPSREIQCYLSTDAGSSTAVTVSANVKTLVIGLIPAQSSATTTLYLFCNDTTTLQQNDTVEFSEVFVRDLSLTLPEYTSAQLVTLGVSGVLSLLPDLGKYNAYDAGSLVDTVVSGARSVGVNIFDEEMELGAIDNDGIPIPASTKIRSKNYIPLMANTEYMIHRDTPNMLYVFLYDANKNFVRTVQRYTDDSSDSKFTTASNEAYMKFYITGTSYNNDIQISRINGSVSTLNTTYHPYKTDTISLSETVTLRSAGSVSEVLTLETGKKTRPIGSVNMIDLQWTYHPASGSYSDFFDAYLPSDCKKGQSNVASNIICSKGYTPIRSQVIAEAGYDDFVMAIANETTRLIVCDKSCTSLESFESAISTAVLNYELATPLSDEQVCDPIIDNFLEVEGGGTVETIQTQTPVIDNCLDVTYDIIPQ